MTQTPSGAATLLCNLFVELNAEEKVYRQKNAGLKAVTLIATLNPVSQVLW